ncbi:hypothetical protein C1A50_3432 [Paenibacillus polymyxa]|nr:hypothetical protein C1A50_3432 [Paenibacillus polymyxa]
MLFVIEFKVYTQQIGYQLLINDDLFEMPASIASSDFAYM